MKSAEGPEAETGPLRLHKALNFGRFESSSIKLKLRTLFLAKGFVYFGFMARVS